MRAQLIQCLTDEVLPLMASGKNAEDALLKVANDNNYSHTQLEALAQLFNTHKTLSVMEKSANRGLTFHIVDVPELCERYLRVEDNAKKSASLSLNWEMVGAGESLPACLRGLNPDEADQDVEFKDAGQEMTRDKFVSMKYATLQVNPSAPKRALADLEQQRFDTKEDLRRDLGLLVKEARSGHMDFPLLEADALHVHGDKIKPALDTLVEFLKCAHVKVARANRPGHNRLVRESSALILLSQVQANLDQLASLDGSIKTASATMEEARRGRSATQQAVDNAFDFPGGSSAPAQPAEKPRGRSGEAPPKDPASFKTPPTETSPSTGGSGKGDGKGMSGGQSAKGDYFGNLSEGLDKIVSPAKDYATERIKKLLNDTNHRDQRKVDTDMENLKQLTMLQKLMLTDDVLSEADPDQVLSIFNTVRTLMPSIASDPNIMRVTLRSAIQHEGISPFDVKGFLDTEMAHQKTDWNQRQLNANTYKGVPLSGKPQ